MVPHTADFLKKIRLISSKKIRQREPVRVLTRYVLETDGYFTSHKGHCRFSFSLKIWMEYITDDWICQEFFGGLHCGASDA